MNEFALQLRERRANLAGLSHSATLCGDGSEFSLINRRSGGQGESDFQLRRLNCHPDRGALLRDENHENMSKLALY